MQADLTHRVAIVTGGSSGIGRATARLLRECGAKVFVADRDLLPENEAEFAAKGILARRCDVRVDAEVERFVAAVLGEAGRVDILVNNAGIGMVGPLTELTPEQWDACLDVNFRGAYLFTRAVLGPMQRAGGGAIVNVSSNAGLLPRAHDPIYSTSKGALIAFTKSVALCHAKDRIRCNAVCPGPVGDTRMMNADLEKAADPAATAERIIAASPLAKAFGRMISPEEIAQSILYLVSDATCMVTGTSLAIDGGKSLGVPPA